MKPAEFRKLMDAHGVEVVDVAYRTRLSTRTVQNYLDGQKMAKRTMRDLETFAHALKYQDDISRTNQLSADRNKSKFPGGR